MCRGCLFVKVDIESGGDIDGCLKQDIIDELRNTGEFREQVDKNMWSISKFTAKGRMVLDHEEAKLDENHCKESFSQPQPKNHAEFVAQSDAFWKARANSYNSYKQFLYNRMMRAEKLPLAKVRALYPVKRKPSSSDNSKQQTLCGAM